jgi:DNA helicase-2/ATP-dependent DNA helicase PcrA
MDELYFSSCAERRMYGRTMPAEPSLFLRELDTSCLKIVGSAPYGFAGGADRRSPGRRPVSGHVPEAGGGYGRAGRESEAERKAGWRRGDRLFHDDYGYGAVAEVRDSEDGPVVRVCFENGRELRFLSGQQGSNFVKIGQDD